MPFSMSGSDAWSYNRFDAYEAKLKGEEKTKAAEGEVESEQIQERMDEMPAGDVGHEIHKKAMKANQSAIDAVNKRTTKGEKKSMKREELEATGLFSAEEIDRLIESSCGGGGYQSGGKVMGYQEGGEVKKDEEECEKCKGKGCDHCKGKGTHKKEDVKEGAKPDFLDMDKDGNKEEPMKKAIKEKGGKKN